MYSGLSSALVIPSVGKEMVEKLWPAEGSCCAFFFFLPANLICFICACVVLPVPFSLDTEIYFVIKSESTLRQRCCMCKFFSAEFL